MEVRENCRPEVFDPDSEFIEQPTDTGSPWELTLSRDNALFIGDGHDSRGLQSE